jgi:hypothetical protein
MAEQPPVPETVTPEQFFEQLMPMGFAAETQASGAKPPDFTLQYHLNGPGGGDWLVAIEGGRMTARKGSGEANLGFSLSVDDWRDAVLGRGGAALSLIVPPNRPGRPDNSARAKQLKGTLALDLARDGQDPVRMEMSFNSATTPRTLIKMKLGDYVAMQEGRLNGQEAFMTGKLKVEGDLGFLMQIAALNV